MMLREGWNFHNDIAITLEHYAMKQFGYYERPFETIFDADAIERSSFVEVMIVLLRERSSMRNDRNDIDEFVEECSKYVGISGNDLDKEKANELFCWFKKLYC